MRGVLGTSGTEYVAAQAAELKQLQAERAAQEPVCAPFLDATRLITLQPFIDSMLVVHGKCSAYFWYL